MAKKNKDIKAWLDKAFSNITFDKKLADSIRVYRMQYLSQSPGHLAFFGDGVIGTQNIWYKSVFENVLFNNILDIDRVGLEDHIRKTDKEGASLTVPSVYPARKITGDVYNLVLFYMAAKFGASKLSSSLKKRAVSDCLRLFGYRTIAALHSKSFTHLTTDAIAREVYERLSNKFIIKQVKTWDRFITYRVDKILALSKKKRNLLVVMNDDDTWLTLISGLATGIRSTFLIIYKLFLDVKENHVASGDTSLATEIEGEKSIKSVESVESIAQRLLVMTSTDFVNKEKVDIIPSIVPGTRQADLLGLIEDFPALHISMPKVTRSFIRAVIAFSYEVIRTAPDEVRLSTTDTLYYIQSRLGASKRTGSDLILIREKGIKVIAKLSGRDSDQYNIKYRTALVLYIVLISLT